MADVWDYAYEVPQEPRGLLRRAMLIREQHDMAMRQPQAVAVPRPRISDKLKFFTAVLAVTSFVALFGGTFKKEIPNSIFESPRPPVESNFDISGLNYEPVIEELPEAVDEIPPSTLTEEDITYMAKTYIGEAGIGADGFEVLDSMKARHELGWGTYKEIATQGKDGNGKVQYVGFRESNKVSPEIVERIKFWDEYNRRHDRNVCDDCGAAYFVTYEQDVNNIFYESPNGRWEDRVARAAGGIYCDHVNQMQEEWVAMKEAAKSQ